MVAVCRAELTHIEPGDPRTSADQRVVTMAARVDSTNRVITSESDAHVAREVLDELQGPDGVLRLKLVGARAQNWLRQEKSYRAFGTELGRDATPLEAGVERFVDLSKQFQGREAMEAAPLRATCVTLLIDGPADADPWGREALWRDGRVVGRLTSGGWSVAFGKSIGMGYVEPGLAMPGTRLDVRMGGKLWPAEVTQDSPYDPANARIRADG